jgi:hypothetical protein
MDWPGRERLLNVMAQAGVLWLQLTGGELLIDPLFAQTHAAAWDMGMMIQISSNGSRLDQPRTLELRTARPPYRLTLHGRASICKVSRHPQVNLLTEGPEGLQRLAAVADSLVTRHGGCTGCTLSKTCGDLHAASQPLPAGPGPARSLLPARRREVNRP